MLEQIVGGGEENLLRAIPLSVAMDSHLKLTIAQLIRLSNPNCAVSARDNQARRGFGNSLRVHIVVIRFEPYGTLRLRHYWRRFCRRRDRLSPDPPGRAPCALARAGKHSRFSFFRPQCRDDAAVCP